jgi:hypothetical protein
MQGAGFDVSFRDFPAKGGTGGHPDSSPSEDVFCTLETNNGLEDG